MKTGRTLTELAQEIERQRESKIDYIAPTPAALMIAPAGGEVQLDLQGHMPLALNDLAHRQVSDHTGIPAKYYDSMRAQAPALLATNVNHWFTAKPAERMVRTLDGRVRAFLSDRYRPLENSDLAEAALPTLLDLDLEIISCEITERRLYIKAVDKAINRDIPTGRMGDGRHTIFDTVSPAIVISNSEVGSGALSIETAVWTKACTNLAIFAQRSMKKYHTGARHEIGDDVVAMLSEGTRRLTDAATWAQVRDVVRAAFDQARFDASIKGLTEMVEGPEIKDPVRAIEVAARQFDFGEAERGSVLQHLARGGDLTRYGLFNAITRTAEDLADYDRATEFERAGGKVIELNRDQWRQIAEAA